MAFLRPTLQQIVDRIESDFQTRITGADTLLRRSVLKVLARVYGGAIHLIYGHLSFQVQQLFASSADGDGLDNIAAEYNLTRTSAVKATGVAIASGTNGIVIPADSELKSVTGEKYITDAAVTISGGTASLALTAVIPGADGNEVVAATLTFTSPITGVNSTATIDSNAITGGTDEETDLTLQQRILRRKQLPPHGGAQYDYVTWALEVSGVTRAWVFSLCFGPGTVGLAFVRENDTNIFPDSSERDIVRNYILEHQDPASGDIVGIPVTAEPGFNIIELFALTVDITVNISPNTATVQSAITSELQDFFDSEAGPGETLYLSRISEAISKATGEIKHTLVSPAADIVAANNQIHVLGTVTYGSY